MLFQWKIIFGQKSPKTDTVYWPKSKAQQKILENPVLLRLASKPNGWIFGLPIKRGDLNNLPGNPQFIIPRTDLGLRIFYFPPI